LRRSGSSVRPSHRRASSSSAGGKARGDHAVTAMSRARSSTAPALATVAGLSVLARGERRCGLNRPACRGERNACAPRQASLGMARHGPGGRRRAAAQTPQWREAVRATGMCGCGAWHRPRAWVRHPYPATVFAARASDRRSVSCLDAHAFGTVRRQADWPCTSSHAHGVPAHSRVKHFSLAPFD
jgi:hypothetical protein